ncbi:MAG: hypothetical protein OEZ06_07180 [Myxococcales bacterium]|nr:hypothetical protein [Myxococcales bacterium]
MGTAAVAPVAGPLRVDRVGVGAFEVLDESQQLFTGSRDGAREVVTDGQALDAEEPPSGPSSNSATV